MAKHDVLTKEEFFSYKPPSRAIMQLQKFIQSTGLSPSEVKVLDWGCGRGRFVLWLREKGFDAYGVDIDPEPIANGLVLFEQKGYHNAPLTLLTPEGHTVYSNGYFNYVMTDNVLEHVSDIDKVIAELSRLTAKNGAGYHIFPAQRQFIEGHLFMPIVHWLPKGAVRKALIRLCVRAGRDPKWKEVEDSSLDEKTEVYYRYSTDHIFYRPFRQIRAKFESQGFTVTCISIQNPAISNNSFLSLLSRVPVIKSLLNWLVLTFKQVELTLQKRG